MSGCYVTGREGGGPEASGSADSGQGWLDQEEQRGLPGPLERPLPAPLPGPAAGLRERGKELPGPEFGGAGSGSKVRAAQARRGFQNPDWKACFAFDLLCKLGRLPGLLWVCVVQGQYL